MKAIDQQLYARANDIEGATYPTSFRAYPGRLMDFGFSPGAYAGTLTSNSNPLARGAIPSFTTTLQVAGTTPSGNDRIRCRGIYAAYLDNLPDTHKTDVFGRFTYDLDSNNQFFFEGSFARNHNIGRIAPVPIDQTAAHIRPDGTQPNILLPLTSRYAPIALLTRLGYNTADVITPGFLEIAVRSADAGNRINDITADQTRFSTGFKGTVAGWDYDTALTYAQASDKLSVTGYIQEQRYIAALATGNLNPFGPNDAVGQALLDGAKMEGDMRKSTSTMTEVDGKLSREIFAMGGGNAALAIGVDVRREEIDDKAVNADYGAGLHIGGEGTVPNTQASRNVAALFGELSLPITQASWRLAWRRALGPLQRRGLEGEPAGTRAVDPEQAAPDARLRRQGLPGSLALGPSQPPRLRQLGQRRDRPGLPREPHRGRGCALRRHPVERAQHRFHQPQARDLDAMERRFRVRADVRHARSRWTTGASRRRTPSERSRPTRSSQIPTTSRSTTATSTGS